MTKEQAAEQAYPTIDLPVDKHSLHLANGDAKRKREAFGAGWDACLANFWIDAVENKPTKDTETLSIEVLFWEENELHPYFGFYNYSINRWIINGSYLAIIPRKVKYFAYVTNPYQQEK